MDYFLQGTSPSTSGAREVRSGHWTAQATRFGVSDFTGCTEVLDQVYTRALKRSSDKNKKSPIILGP